MLSKKEYLYTYKLFEKKKIMNEKSKKKESNENIFSSFLFY